LKSRVIYGYKQGSSARPIDADRLLRPHVLACRDRLRRYLGMNDADRQVHDDLDIGIGEHVVDGTPLSLIIPVPMKPTPTGPVSAIT